MITVLDLRTMQVLQTMENPTHFGPITCMCMDRKRTWIVVGTSSGVLSLWDRRFGLLLRSWRCAAAVSGKPTRIHQCVLHPSKGRGRWIIVAVETIKPSTDASLITLVEVWDVERCTIVESYSTRSTSTTSSEVEEPRDISGLDAENDPAAAMATLVRSRRSVDKHTPSENLAKDEVLPPSPDVRAMIAGLEFGGHSTHRLDINDLNLESSHISSRPGGHGFLITGSEDRKVRLWDLDKLERTAVLTEYEPEYEKPSYRCATLTLFTLLFLILVIQGPYERATVRRQFISRRHCIKLAQIVNSVVLLKEYLRWRIVSETCSDIITMWSQLWPA
jgi:phosphoinositide-3-kinase, regulatory subunit 4